MKTTPAITLSGDDVFSEFFNEANDIASEIKKVKSIQIKSTTLREKIKKVVKDYFRLLRPILVARDVPIVQLDGLMQELMKMANAYTSKKVYRKNIEEVCKELGEIEVGRERIESNLLISSRVDRVGIIQPQDEIILKALEKIIPVASFSYRQVIEDLQGERFSYRGTAGELREVLREVLDYLASDSDVQSAKGFNFEEGQKKPTMKQKVKFILKNRKKGETAIEVPEGATLIIDEGIAKLVRSTYNRGSLSAHTKGDGLAEIIQLKRYLDGVLCELLEIH